MGEPVYVALGGNLGDPAATFERALRAMDALPGTALLRRSSLYRNAPLTAAGDERPQPDYLNAVALLESGLAPLGLLDALQAIEQAEGRVRGPRRWGARTLDLDILLFGGRIIGDQRLTVPHPGLAQRAFFLIPLAEVAPGLEIPGLGRVEALRECCPPWRIERVAWEPVHSHPPSRGR